MTLGLGDFIMRKLLLAGLGLAALITAPAMAADMPLKALKAPPPPIFTWTGCFLGGNGGGLWVRKEWTDALPGSPTFGQSYGTHNPNSWAAGVQGGCDWQWGGWVVGFQGDFDWARADGSNVNVLFPAITDNTRVKSIASATLRIGYAWDRFLLYVRGGGAWEKDDYQFRTVATNAVLGTGDELRGGGTFGVGGEYAFTNWVSAFVEYDYYWFGTRGVDFVTPAGGAFTRTDIRENKSVLKAGLNFRIGPAPAVVAKY
jgi:outer membrane immunogenic protein